MGQLNWDESIPRVTWAHVMKGFKGHNQYPKLDLERKHTNAVHAEEVLHVQLY